MKNLSFTLNAALLVAVGILYYLHFSKNKPLVQKENPTAIETSLVRDTTRSSENAKMPSSYAVYVNTDTLFKYYDFYKKAKTDFESKKEKMEAELNAKGKALEKKYMEAQQKAQSGTMTQEQMQATEQNLTKEQQDLMQLKQDQERKLMDENEKLVEILNSKISNFLKEQSKSNNYKFVFGYSNGGELLYGDDSLDITKQLIEGLNKEYKQGK
jgi:outer membrane protein